jgi:4-hydroxy-2-oxoheptanedioate aldolase
MRRNRLRELLKADKPSLGTHLMCSWPTIVELAGQSGMFDYVEFLAEYAPYDLYALENLGRAVALFDHMTAMMKIEQEPRNYLTIRAIGSGIQNVLFADPRTVEDVGVKHFCVGWDVSILFNWFKDCGQAMRRLLGAKSTSAEAGKGMYPA